MERTLGNKRMHILLIIYLAITLLASLFVIKNDIGNLISETNLKNVMIFTITLLDVIFTLFLFKWKRWALYGLGVTTLITFIYNLSKGYGLIVSIIGLFGYLIIFPLLFLKKEGKNGFQNLN